MWELLDEMMDHIRGGRSASMGGIGDARIVTLRTATVEDWERRLHDVHPASEEGK